MNVTEFKDMLINAIETHERSCVYVVSDNEKGCVLSAYVNGSHFFVKCYEIKSDSNTLLR